MTVTEKYIKIRDKALDDAIKEVFDNMGRTPLPAREELFEMILEIAHLNPNAKLPRKVIELIQLHNPKETKLVTIGLPVEAA